MDTPVMIAADVTGAVIGMSNNNPEFGYIRVQQVARKIGKGGWFSFSKRSALLKGTVEDLKAANFEDGDILPGKIVIKESLTPFYAEDADKHIKRAGDGGPICTLDDQPIYRDSIYTTNMNDEDELIDHNNGDYIKHQIELQKEKNASTSNLSGLKNLINS